MHCRDRTVKKMLAANRPVTTDPVTTQPQQSNDTNYDYDNVIKRESIMKSTTISTTPNADYCEDDGSDGNGDGFATNEKTESDAVHIARDTVERDPDYMEDRFRVDRRKLEMLIQADTDDEENAEDFFTKIMQETNVHIAWPSKLKIGAKSKKDPHIKLSGKKAAVVEAKARVMTMLDTKSLRVTLKLDVSHTDHSHVIGKGGNNIKRVMQETGCHIHFPDSNRNAQVEKSNQVSIAGVCPGVEQARNAIRDLLPLLFVFEVPNTGSTLSMDLAALVQQTQAQYGVVVTIKQLLYSLSIVVRGSYCAVKMVKEAVNAVSEALTGRSGSPYPVTLLLDIAPQHHPLIIGHGSANIQQIMQSTGAKVHFPDGSSTPSGLIGTIPFVSCSPSTRRGTVYVTGTLPSICAARQQLLSCLPLVLMFDIKDDVDISQVLLSELMTELDVFIGIKQKTRQPTKAVIVKSIERNVANLYKARRRILDIGQESELTTTSTSQETKPLPNSEQLAGNSTTTCHSTSVTLISQNKAPVQISVSQILRNNAAAVRQPTMIPISAYHQLPHAFSSSPLQFTSPPMTSGLPLPPHNYPNEFHTIPRTLNIQNSVCQLPPMHLQCGPLNMSPVHQTISTPRPVFGISPPSHRYEFGVSPPPLVLNATKDSFRQIPLYESQISPGSQFSTFNSVTAICNGQNRQLTLQQQQQEYQLQQQQLCVHQLRNQQLQQLHSAPVGTVYGSTPGGNSLAGIGIVSPNPYIHNSQFGMKENYPVINNNGGYVVSEENSNPSYVCKSDTQMGEFSQPISGCDTVAYSQYLESIPQTMKDNFLGQIAQSLTTSGSKEFKPTFNENAAQYPSSDGHNFDTVTAGVRSMEITDLYKAYNGAELANFCDNADRESMYHDMGSRAELREVTGQVSKGNMARVSPLCKEKHNLIDDQVEDEDDAGQHLSSYCGGEGFHSSEHYIARGCNRPNQLVQSDLDFDPEHSNTAADINYDEMKLRANKAMREKPGGESRIPTDYWAGLGFSKSMPGVAIREKLALNHINHYTGPTMTTTFESCEGENENDAWAEESHLYSGGGCGSNALLENTDMLRESLNDLVATISSQLDSGAALMKDSSSIWSIKNQVSNRPLAMTKLTESTNLADLFNRIGLGKYTDLFQQQEIDLATFLTLSDQDFKDLGVTTFGARRKMVLAIADYNERKLMIPPPPGLPNPFRQSGHTGFVTGRHDIVSQSGRW